MHALVEDGSGERGVGQLLDLQRKCSSGRSRAEGGQGWGLVPRMMKVYLGFSIWASSVWFCGVSYSSLGRSAASVVPKDPWPLILKPDFPPLPPPVLPADMFDKTKSGRIDVYGFSALWKFIQQWKNLFQQYDRDHSGSISYTELQQGEGHDRAQSAQAKPDFSLCSLR